MRRSVLAVILALLVSACTTTSFAPSTTSVLPQSAPVDAGDGDDWTWRVTPYVWAADMDGNTTVRGNVVDIDVPFSDTLDHLDTGGQLQVEARKGRWAFFVDATDLELSADGNVEPGAPSLPSGPVKLEIDLLIAGAGALFQVSPDMPLELGAGVRYLSFDTKLELPGGPDVRADVSFTDGVVIARHRWALDDAERWELGVYGDIGKGDSDLTWQGVVTANRRFENWGLSLGYRYLDYDLGGSRDTDLTFSGVLLGANLFF